MKVSKVFSESKARKWMWLGLAAFFALQIYFVQEMLAALMLFTGVFVVFALGCSCVVSGGSRRSVGLGLGGEACSSGRSTGAPGVGAAEEISKKPFHRPRSETAQ